MAIRELHKPLVVKATRKLAKEFAEIPGIRGDRDERKQRMKKLDALLDSGKMISTIHWVRAKILSIGEVVRINGKHTSKMFLERKKFPNIYVTIHDFECDTFEDACELYAQFDSKLSIESLLEIKERIENEQPEDWTT